MIDRLKTWGPAVILTDGDVVFQPRKIERSGIARGGRRERAGLRTQGAELDDVERRYPAERYVFVDDKLRLLTAFKEVWGSRVTTVFPRQGHYARDPDILRAIRRRPDGGSNRRARRRGFRGVASSRGRRPLQPQPLAYRVHEGYDHRLRVISSTRINPAMEYTMAKNPDSDDQTLTTRQGHPVTNNESQRTVGSRGPATMENYHFLEKISHFDRERIPGAGRSRARLRRRMETSRRPG